MGKQSADLSNVPGTFVIETLLDNEWFYADVETGEALPFKVVGAKTESVEKARKADSIRKAKEAAAQYGVDYNAENSEVEAAKQSSVGKREKPIVKRRKKHKKYSQVKYQREQQKIA